MIVEFNTDIEFYTTQKQCMRSIDHDLIKAHKWAETLILCSKFTNMKWKRLLELLTNCFLTIDTCISTVVAHSHQSAVITVYNQLYTYHTIIINDIYHNVMYDDTACKYRLTSMHVLVHTSLNLMSHMFEKPVQVMLKTASNCTSMSLEQVTQIYIRTSI